MAGDQTSARAAIIAALTRVRRFALGLTGNTADADDLLQATVERALARDWSEPVGIDKWMFRVCRNLWIDELRSRRVREGPPGSRIDAGEIQVDGSDTLLSEMTLDEVMGAMNTLPEEQRAVLTLVAVEGLSYRDAADVLEIPAGTVMSRLARARSALASRFQGEHSKG